MKAFDVVRKVLDSTYAMIPNENGDRDERIKESISGTRNKYLNNVLANGGPDFDDPATRFGYVFTYVAAHAHWVHEIISECNEAQAIFQSGKARVACVGGGPGSDLVGILKYLDEKKIVCNIFAEIIDGCEPWKTTWSDVAFELEMPSLHTDYVIHDLGDTATWDSPSNVAKADIITISFFISEIYHIGTAPAYVERLLKAAKPGAIVFVLDNRLDDLKNALDGLAITCGFDTLLSDEGIQKIYDAGEQTDAVQDYKEKFKSNPRLTGDMMRRIFRKK